MNFQLPFSPKDYAAGVGGLASGLIVFVVRAIFHLDDGDCVTLGGLLLLVLPPVITRFTPPGDQLVLRHINDDIAQAGTILGKLTPASDSAAPITPAAAALAAKVT